MQMYDVIIAGTGPAGLTAAIYGTRARLKMLVFEENYMSGGQVVNTYEVDNYPGLPEISGMDLSLKFREHAEKLGAEFVRAKVNKIEVKEDGTKIVETESGTYETRAFVLATGAHHRLLNVPGEESLSGMGVSYCATCDGAFYKGSDVAVIGGGDVAVEDAIFLARGCRRVYVVHRRDELRAAKSLQEKLFSLPNVEMVWDSVVDSIEGEEQVDAIRIKNIKDGTVRAISVDGVFVAVGITPDSDLLKGIVKMDEGGYILADESCRTSVPGIFSAGDVRKKPLRQIITAAADGANAITSVEKYLIEA
ncbi:MAG: thioredoxin-disulfide reductase [Lachnospiraceae bacterium]|nr:thioredoxin-disulfide reductase [Lachnospiraceae bacterium]